MCRRYLLAVSLLVAVLFPGKARAANTSPLSSLEVSPALTPLRTPEATTPIPGLSMKIEDLRGARLLELVAAKSRGYCIVSSASQQSWLGSFGSASASPTVDLELQRLIEKDGSATLERTRVHFDPPSATITATGRSHVSLKEVARTPDGNAVWAYREGRQIVVLAKNVRAGLDATKTTTQSPDGDVVPSIVVDGCSYAGMRLDARKPEAGSIAQLTGVLPAVGRGKARTEPVFVINASLSRVARDPEPLLAVRVTVLE